MPVFVKTANLLSLGRGQWHSRPQRLVRSHRRGNKSGQDLCVCVPPACALHVLPLPSIQCHPCWYPRPYPYLRPCPYLRPGRPGCPPCPPGTPGHSGSTRSCRPRCAPGGRWPGPAAASAGSCRLGVPASRCAGKGCPACPWEPAGRERVAERIPNRRKSCRHSHSG